jgi:hypothetical protein
MVVLLGVPLVVSEGDYAALIDGCSPSISQHCVAIQALFLPIWMLPEAGKP